MRTILFLFLMLGFKKEYAQVTVTGPTCVTPGILYKYIVTGVAPGSSNMQICITGGLIANTDSSCHQGVPVSSVKIIWNTTITGNIAVSGSGGNYSLDVNKAKDFQAGKIDSLRRMQVIKTGGLPVVIFCSAASGGNCAPRYVYQWEESTDCLHWSNKSGATLKDFQFTSRPSQTVYYRRRVLESVSRTEKYSDIAVVSITQ